MNHKMRLDDYVAKAYYDASKRDQKHQNLSSWSDFDKPKNFRNFFLPQQFQNFRGFLEINLIQGQVGLK